ncbi:MAG: hypothetical protein LBQ24_06070 [Candidatus Peribacteria bacterium]|jgi:type II secretory ATPase GspE/PulE/Tfp pilus assembly ATPase PilB-like protein|nr:hypothetical protein [Candidatus Peribacteria bacterium]
MSEQLNNEDPKQSEIDNKDIIDSLDLPDTKDETEGENKVYDINISSINDVLSILILKKYDFVTFEPSDSEVKLDFRKDGVIVETKFIKYPLYSGILLKAKSATKLNLEVTSEEQE